MSSFIAYIRSFPPLRTIVGLLLWTAGLLILLSLWQWQLERLEWKRSLIDQHRYEASIAVLPELSPFNIKTSPVDKFILHKFVLNTDAQQISADKLILIGPRPKDDKPGLHVYYPIPIKDSDVVLISMIGWVAEDKKEDLKTILADTKLPSQITGYFVPESKSNAVKNKPKQDFWVKANIQDMADHYGYQALQSDEQKMIPDNLQSTPRAFFYIENNITSDLEPRLFRDITFKNNHAYYAQFWLSMSIAWSVIFIFAAFAPIIKETFIRKRQNNSAHNQDKDDA
jgi:cytochrome oxidase assembly protein ShyY1